MSQRGTGAVKHGLKDKLQSTCAGLEGAQGDGGGRGREGRGCDGTTVDVMTVSLVMKQHEHEGRGCHRETRRTWAARGCWWRDTAAVLPRTLFTWGEYAPE